MSDAHGTQEPVYRRLVDGGLLYDPASGEIHHMNETAARVYEAWRDDADAAAIVQRLAADYDAPEEAIRIEVDAVLARLDGAATEEPETSA